jgi:UPF0716 protein FxsA
MWLFILFVAVPIIEIALFIQVGGWIGLWATLAIVVLTAALGTVLVRAQGLQTLRTLQSNVERGGDPMGPIAHGALILLAGVLLLTPGFFTDAVAVALLIPTATRGRDPVGRGADHGGRGRQRVSLAPERSRPRARTAGDRGGRVRDPRRGTAPGRTGHERSVPAGRDGGGAAGNGDARPGRSQWTRPPR